MYNSHACNIELQHSRSHAHIRVPLESIIKILIGNEHLIKAQQIYALILVKLLGIVQWN